jgi:hypothetical protein
MMNSFQLDSRLRALLSGENIPNNTEMQIFSTDSISFHCEGLNKETTWNHTFASYR